MQKQILHDFFREVLVVTMPEQSHEWQDEKIDVTKLWRIELPSYKLHVSFLYSSESALSGILTTHRGIPHLFLIPNHDNLLGYYFKNTDSWQMIPIALTNQTIIPFKCSSNAIMCSIDKFSQMTLI